jgi:shikimate dehydrogenase
MKLFFVIGENASKSLSPLIFNHWFKKYKIKARYFYVETKKQNFEKIISQTVLEKKISGFNVTTPYKKTIFNFLDLKNSHARKIQAVNCVTLGDKTKGINTDWIGYKNSIKKLNINKNSNIVILGFGGAAQAIIYSFVSGGFKNIVVFNRTKKLIKLGGVKRYTKKYSLIKKYLMKADLLINTTPTNPLNKKQSKVVNHKTLVSDIVYNPKNTVFLKQFKSNSKIYGISMLIEQAIPCFHVWFGFTPIVDKVLLKKIDKEIK